MSVYNCFECDGWFDGDFFPAIEHPDDACALTCEECAAELEEHADMKKEYKSMKAEYEREIISGIQRKLK